MMIDKDMRGRYSLFTKEEGAKIPPLAALGRDDTGGTDCHGQLSCPRNDKKNRKGVSEDGKNDTEGW